MYPKHEINPTYVGTTYAAKMLHLSVGTVQKLVGDGSLKAYLTSGGHRRISFDSVINYSQKNNIPVAVAGRQGSHGVDAISIGVLFSEKSITPNLADIVKDGTFQVFSDPLKLIRASGEITHIFIDARIEWMNWQQMERLSNEVHYVVYNSDILSDPTTRKHMGEIATLIDSDISIELLHGYLLGMKANFTRQSMPVLPEIVRQ